MGDAAAPQSNVALAEDATTLQGATSQAIQISIDRGGTFTDIHASVPGRDDIVLKVLSVDPANYSDAPTEGIRRVLELVTGQPHPRGVPLDTASIERIRMGTTVGTNALLERKGARSALLITKGFKDLLRIGTQSRPRIFDLTVARPDLLYQAVVEVDERVVRVLREPDMAVVRDLLEGLWQQGFRSLSVVLMHSYVYPEHERRVGALAAQMGFSVVESAALQPMIKAVPRGMSATADAYLTPIIKQYIDSISSNFRGGLAAPGLRCEFMQSDGGLVDFRGFSGLKSILSGPAGGVVGYAQTSWDNEQRKPVIGFDMGGTSTDVSRFAGTYEHVFETVTAGISIQSPQLDIITVAAGGGSMLFWRNGLFAVGPESAGAHPGPACYRKGGPLTITDANVFLGRVVPEYFPKIFGPNEDEPLDTQVVADKFAQLTAEINADNQAAGRNELTAEQVALGFLRVASEVMARPIRALTEARGFDASDHILSCFGGAGGQHACDVAQALSISQVVIHKYSSILSAYGLALADLVHETQRPAAITFTANNYDEITKVLSELSAAASDHLVGQKVDRELIRLELYLNMRYEGSNSSFMVMQESGEEIGSFQRSFEERHLREFGFVFPGKKILIDDFRVRAIGSTASSAGSSPYQQRKHVANKVVTLPTPEMITKVCFEAQLKRVDTPIYLMAKLEPGSTIPGPALVLDNTQTLLVVPGTVATILESSVMIDLEDEQQSAQVEQAGVQTSEDEVNPIKLSIFSHRFMSIAEQMGRTLQKTAVSTNIKERLDFSCALFSPDGGLVANAPHVPVHLGSMQFCVRHMHEMWKGRLFDGDVLVSNHPESGGTHLPDITVVTPVFDDSGKDIVFYVASRGHHADIGGSLPGSMPPDSKWLYEEGAAILGEKLVSNGCFNEDRIIELLVHEPAKHPGISGTRGLADNLSDLKAQVAANQQGINLIRALIQEHGMEQVHRYMFAIQDNAEQAVRALLRRMKAKHEAGGSTADAPPPLRAVDYMDDGTPIALAVSIDSEKGSAVFDFTGTGPQVYGNTNAPMAITHSAIIYCLRALVASDIPLNQGCLKPIEVRVPPRSILAPAAGASVVGGNVLTSQRITDVVLTAFGACADSSGCMNNLTFGIGGKKQGADGQETLEKGFGCYETIGGGAGAGPSWDGTSGVHTHMTNTRITDPEVLEKRYPVLLHEFSIRPESGGTGARPGGNGIVRDIEFTVPGVQVSILSERRARAPKGAAGGGDGAPGRNLWVRKADGLVVNMGGKATATFACGDRIVIQTPGGGAWGAKAI
ncbi:hydantoinase [Microdochium trichocladiopsis]|uniref:Hydantoinase n=1 Tax=Microdochium trichocladiopsis TaxID=1682393 RepID=A0A9P8Y7N4_9PEZI|nr:hydantoinase [Microdochium trichocladiopsis]KAH7029893.1 hydantoinase [Microdochium trichocladiopsis]